MSATVKTLCDADFRVLPVEEQRAIDGGGLFSSITNAIKSATPPSSAASSVIKKDNDTLSAIVGKI